jgi:DNA-binding transcriptional LysR family regulator
LAVTRILDQYPHASVEIFDGSYRELLDELRHGRIDLIVGALRDPAPTREIVQEPLFVDRLSVILGPHHPLAGRPELSDADIARLDWIVSRKGTPARRQFEEFLRRRNLPVPDNVIECGSLVAVRGLLSHGLRATLLSERQVSYELRHGLLARAGQPMAGTERTIGLTWRAQDRPTPMQAAFADLLRTISLGQVS